MAKRFAKQNVRNGVEGDCQLSAFEDAKADIAVPKGMDCEKAAVRSP